VVEGLDLFKARFADFADQYVLIGGAACTVAMQNVGIDFRATKDLDIVLCVEVLDADFAKAFWQFVRDGRYENQEHASGKRQFYRFTKPQTDGFPFMLELFSRTLDTFTPAEGSVLTPIPFGDEGFEPVRDPSR
jgi:glutathionyl-hydroquinone reductase